MIYLFFFSFCQRGFTLSSHHVINADFRNLVGLLLHCRKLLFLSLQPRGSSLPWHTFQGLFSQEHPELCSLSASTESCQITFLLISLCLQSPPRKASNTGRSLQEKKKKSFICMMTLKSSLFTPTMQDYKNTATTKTILKSKIFNSSYWFR